MKHIIYTIITLEVFHLFVVFFFMKSYVLNCSWNYVAGLFEDFSLSEPKEVGGQNDFGSKSKGEKLQILFSHWPVSNLHSLLTQKCRLWFDTFCSCTEIKENLLWRHCIIEQDLFTLKENNFQLYFLDIVMPTHYFLVSHYNVVWRCLLSK